VSKRNLDISLCSISCSKQPGYAAFWITAFNKDNSRYYTIKSKYSREITKLAAGQQLPISVEISPTYDGSFSGRITVFEAGSYVLNYTLNNIPIYGSPFTVNVFPSSLDLDANQTSTVMDPSILYLNGIFSAGFVVLANVKARNKYGVLVDKPNLNTLSVNVRNNPAIPVSIGFDSTGRFRFS
jgi:hypothetical protein